MSGACPAKRSGITAMIVRGETPILTPPTTDRSAPSIRIQPP
jgi:hypothetical protein